MSTIHRLYSVPLLCLSLCPIAHAQDAVPAPTLSHKTYPQIVRLSLLQGDVRVSRGKAGEKATGQAWEQAELNLPIAAGYSLVTGDGLAEIEFEDASTMYLGTDSVLAFNELTSKDGITHTAVELISGTLATHISPAPGEWFSIKTPTDHITLKYPAQTTMRVNSFIDAMGVTPLEVSHIQLGDTTLQALPGQMTLFRDGQMLPGSRRISFKTYAVFDKWVTDRIHWRAAAMVQAMRDSGLKVPLAGLADMESRGHFFDCAPYGKCWEPNDAPATHGPQEPPDTVQQSVQQTVQSVQQTAPAVPLEQDPFAGSPVVLATNQGNASGQTSAQASTRTQPLGLYDEEDYFPCGPASFDYWAATRYGLPGGGYQTGYPWYYMQAIRWPWAVCHAGSWIHQGRRYVWVAQPKRHHHAPLRWVNLKGRPAFVPLHPRDVKGETPHNLRNGLFTVKDGEQKSLERVVYNDGAPLKLLDEEPKDFRKPYYAALPPAEEPKVEARLLSQAGFPRFVGVRPVGTPITFDHKSQSFVMAHQEFQDGHNVTVRESLGSAGRGGGNSASAGPSNGSGRGSGGGGGSFSGGGGSAGGGSHSSGGGGSFGGGGGGGGVGHSSGGGGGASSGGGGGASGGGGGTHK